jgi:hypothetical protein
MTAGNLETSAHFRANLGVLDATAAQVFTNWAAVSCVHHVIQEENGSTVLYATRREGRTEQQHKNALKSVASNRKIKLKTEPAFVQLLQDEYEVVGGGSSDVQMEEPSREATLRMPCEMEILTQLPDGFDAHAGALLRQIASAC